MNSALNEAVHGFLHNRAEAEVVTANKTRYRDALHEFLMQNGRVDENGHRYFDFNEPLTVGGKTYRAIKAERRISASIDIARTERLARDKGLYDTVFPVVPKRVFDEDALYVANQQGLISDEELDALITEDVTYAIVAVK